MASEEVDTQSVSLMEHEIHDEEHEEKLLADQTTRKSRSFWPGIFRRKGSRNAKAEEEDEMEDSSLLASDTIEFISGRRGEDEELDDYRDDGEGTPARQSLLGASDGEESSEEDDSQEGGPSALVSDEESLDENETEAHIPDLINMHASDSILDYRPLASEGGNDASGDESSDSSEEEEEYDDDDDELEAYDRVGSLNLAPPRLLTRSQSVNSYCTDYSDYNSSPIVDPENRKRIKGRIEGFGTTVADPLASPKISIREKIRNLAARYRMRKMSIGTEDTINRKSWIERFDKALDKVMADPELEGYLDAAQITQLNRFQRDDDPQQIEIKRKQWASGSHKNEVGSTSFRRKELGDIDDTSYIMFLEIELQNKELELNSWRRRAEELEKQVRQLKGETSENDDDSSTTDSSASNQQEQQESEIEWETGTTKEGILIEVEGSTHETAMLPMAPFVQVASQEVDSGQEVSFMLLQAPDSPDEEEEELGENNALPKNADVESDEEHPEEPEDVVFPVLSTNHNSGTVWMDVSQLGPAAIPSSKSEVLSNSQLLNEKESEESDNVGQGIEDNVMSNEQGATSLKESKKIELAPEKTIGKGDTGTENSGNTVSAETSIEDEESPIEEEEDVVDDRCPDSESEGGQGDVLTSNLQRSIMNEEILNV